MQHVDVKLKTNYTANTAPPWPFTEIEIFNQKQTEKQVNNCNKIYFLNTQINMQYVDVKLKKTHWKNKFQFSRKDLQT